MYIVSVDAEKCEGCEACASNCPNNVYQIIDDKSQVVNKASCEGCETCVDGCPAGAITVTEMAAAAI